MSSSSNKLHRAYKKLVQSHGRLIPLLNHHGALIPLPFNEDNGFIRKKGDRRIKLVIRKGRIYYHNGLFLHVEEEGVIIPLGPMLHVLGQEEGFTHTFSYLVPTAFPSWSDPINREEGNPIHCERMHVSRSSHDINKGIP